MSVRTNIIANYLGSAWTALMGLVFVPTYIRFMGIEAYGLVGFFGTLLAMFSILDLGLSATLNREMARRSVSPELFQTTRDLLRTIEVIYWGMAVLIGAAVVVLSHPISQYWINPGKLSAGDVQQAVLIMGLVVVLRWPFGMYQGGLMGLQRQVLVNIINSVSATFRGVGAVLVLWMVSPTIQAFFLWQIIVSGLETLLMGFFLWSRLGDSPEKPQFKAKLITEVLGFASGMFGISMVTMLLTQVDKLLLSKLLPLEMYGYYMLAWTIAGSLNKFAGPMFGAIFPKFSQLVVSENRNVLIELYHRSCQLLTVVVFPPAAVLIFFPYQSLLIWTGNSEIADGVHAAMSLLVIGSAFNSIMIVPYALLLAFGCTSLVFWVNAVSLIILIPFLYVMVNQYGMLGATFAWMMLNLGYAVFIIGFMHRRLLIGEACRWYIHDVSLPLMAVVSTICSAKLLFDTMLPNSEMLILLIGLCLLGYFVAMMCAPIIREPVFKYIGRLIAYDKN